MRCASKPASPLFRAIRASGALHQSLRECRLCLPECPRSASSPWFAPARGLPDARTYQPSWPQPPHRAELRGRAAPHFGHSRIPNGSGIGSARGSPVRARRRAFCSSKMACSPEPTTTISAHRAVAAARPSPLRYATLAPAADCSAPTARATIPRSVQRIAALVKKLATPRIDRPSHRYDRHAGILRQWRQRQRAAARYSVDLAEI